MFSDSLWYLSAVAYTENGETRYLTADGSFILGDRLVFRRFEDEHCSDR